MFSNAKEIAANRFKRLWKIKTGSIIYVVVALPYMVWRTTVFNSQAPVASTIFYLAELYGCLLGLSLIYINLRHRVRTASPLTQKFTVDVLIPVYTEPAEMIELTVIGASEIDYPHETYLLDDGKREEIRLIAEKHGIHYVRRPNNKGAKAGNLNHGLSHCHGDMVAVFDADHIAQREALDKLLPYMADPAVGMVQAPQCFYNEDSFLYRDIYVGAGRWHEQAFFMDIVQCSQDAEDSATGIGTGVVYRRSALDQIGGFPEKTITEDIHTSLLMHKQGLKTAYLNEPVAWGVAAADVAEFNKTRRRWAHGNLHALMLENILFCKELSWRKRIPYLAMGLQMQECWQQLVFLLIPALSMIFYVTPFAMTVPNAIVILTVPLVLIVALIAAGGGYLLFLPTQVFSIGKMFVQISGSRGLLGKPLGWQVSLKNVLGRVSLGMMASHTAILICSVLGVLFAALRVTGVLPYSVPPVGGLPIIVISCFWVGFNFWRSWRWIRDSVGLTRRTHEEYLFEVELPVLDPSGHWIGTTSKTGTALAVIEWHSGFPPEAGSLITFVTPGFLIQARALNADDKTAILRFECLTPHDFDRLRRGLYSVDWHRLIRLSQFATEAARQGLGGVWKPALLHTIPQPSWCVVLQSPNASSPLTLITSAAISPGDTLGITTSNGSQLKSHTALVSHKVIPDTPFPRGLNNQLFDLFMIDFEGVPKETSI